MILFLRNSKNRTIVDCECYVKTENEKKFIEISVDINISAYSEFLLGHPNDAHNIIFDFTVIQNLRSWLWERYFVGEDNDPEKYLDVIGELRKLFTDMTHKYNLYYVED